MDEVFRAIDSSSGEAAKRGALHAKINRAAGTRVMVVDQAAKTSFAANRYEFTSKHCATPSTVTSG
jgi:hypothetical protein